MVDKIADVLTGKTTPDIYKDDQGNSYVYHPAMTRGQQWERIASEAIRRSWSGRRSGRTRQQGESSRGRSPGWSEVRRGGPGKRKGRDQRRARQANLDKANNQILQMNMAKNAWDWARMKVKASQEDISFNDNQEKTLTDQGGKVIGTAAHPGDIAEHPESSARRDEATGPKGDHPDPPQHRRGRKRDRDQSVSDAGELGQDAPAGRNSGPRLRSDREEDHRVSMLIRSRKARLLDLRRRGSHSQRQDRGRSTRSRTQSRADKRSECKRRYQSGREYLENRFAEGRRRRGTSQKPARCEANPWSEA